MINKEVSINFDQINKLVRHSINKMTENQSSLTDSLSVMTDRVGSVCPDRVVCNNVDKQTGCLILYGGGVCESRTHWVFST